MWQHKQKMFNCMSDFLRRMLTCSIASPAAEIAKALHEGLRAQVQRQLLLAGEVCCRWHIATGACRPEARCLPGTTM